MSTNMKSHPPRQELARTNQASAPATQGAAMLTSDFDFQFPEQLVATEPSQNFRILLGGDTPAEITKSDLFQLFQSGDVLVINDTRVLKRRVTALNGLEILFLSECDVLTNLTGATTSANPNGDDLWQVLFPAREVKDGEEFELPDGVKAKLIKRGLPQIISVSQTLDEDYFADFGEFALPPYIQKARGERNNREDEGDWYQTAWASHDGSVAAPTASLHFTQEDLNELKTRGVEIVTLTLHVGIGTFLPVKSEKLDDHQMHSETVQVMRSALQKISQAKAENKKVWALGTTVTRALESWACGKLPENSNGDIFGSTDLFIKPGYNFEVVDALLTNFHQPRSTLLALVSAFAAREQVLKNYQWAVSQNFRLFSYGDLTVWLKR